MNALLAHDGTLIDLTVRKVNLDAGLKALRELTDRRMEIAPLMTEFFDRTDVEPAVAATKFERGVLSVVVTPSDDLWAFLTGSGATPFRGAAWPA